MAKRNGVLGNPAAFNAALAGFTALALAFAVYAMPESLFSDIVRASGAPALVPAAEPPLGQTARYAVMAGAALACFLAVWLTLRACDHAVAPDQAEPADDFEWETPRARRADAHPDAPTRRPLFAGEELGEPGDNLGTFLVESDELEPMPAEDASVPQPPSFLAGNDQYDVTEPLDLTPWTAQAAEPEPDEEPEIVPETLASAQPVVPEDQPYQPETHSAPNIEVPPVAVHSEDETSPEPVPVPEKPQPEGLLARLALPEDKGESVSSLLDRLDAGLAGCEWPLDEANDSQPREDVAEQLRSALDDLHRIARRSA